MYLPSMDLLIAHPAKIMEMRYKMKLMTARGAVNALPTPKAMLMMMMMMSRWLISQQQTPLLHT
jgi:hypothetical protein